MVQYKGYISDNGELVIDLGGNEIPLREFLQAKGLTGRKRQNPGSSRHKEPQTEVAAVK